MGKGDKRTKRGKMFRKSYGKARPHSTKKKVVPTTAPVETQA